MYQYCNSFTAASDGIGAPARFSISTTCSARSGNRQRQPAFWRSVVTLSILAVVPMAQHLLGDPPRSGVIGNPLDVIRYPLGPCANRMGSHGYPAWFLGR